MKKVAIVILNYNGDKLTHNCLKYITKVETPNFYLTTIVVDNASRKPFVLSNKERKQSIIVIRNNKNLGFTGGCNAGMSYAIKNQYNYVMLLNNDTIVDKNLVKELFEVAENNPNIGLLGPKIYFSPGHEFHKKRYTREEEGKVIWYAGGNIDWANIYSNHRGVDHVDRGQYNIQEPTDYITGCCMFIPITVLQKVGLFDNKYFLYYEDGDLNERVKRAKYEILYIPTAKLWHIAGGSTEGIGSSLQDYFLTRNRMLFGLRYAPLRSKFALIRESFRFLLTGRKWQKIGIKDFYIGKLGKGSYPLEQNS